MPSIVVKKVNDMGRRSKRERYGRELEFPNQKKEQFDWDNMELEDDAMILVEDTPIHPTITAEIPGNELEEEQIGPISAVEEVETSEAELALAVMLNTNLVFRPKDDQPQNDCDVPGVDITWVPTLVDEEMGDFYDDDVDIIDGP